MQWHSTYRFYFIFFTFSTRYHQHMYIFLLTSFLFCLYFSHSLYILFVCLHSVRAGIFSYTTVCICDRGSMEPCVRTISYHKKKIIIHVPVKKSHHKHTHTQVKNIHHHHKPIVIKEEKVIKEIVKKPIPIKIKEEISHDHYHHHYKHTHPEEILSKPKPTSNHWLSDSTEGGGWDSGNRFGSSGNNNFGSSGNFGGSSFSNSFSNSFGSYGSASSNSGSSSGSSYENTNFRGGRKVASAAEAARLSGETY